MSMLLAAICAITVASPTPAEPKYRLRFLEYDGTQRDHLNAVAGVHEGVNKHGDYTVCASKSQRVVKGCRNFSIRSIADVDRHNFWRSYHVWDINDSGVVLGAFQDEHAKGVYLASGSELGEISSTRLAGTDGFSPVGPVAEHMEGFINERRDVVFNVWPYRAVRLEGSQLKYLHYSSTGAKGSYAYGLAETGDVCGILMWNPEKGKGGRGVVWTADGTLIQLPMPEGAEYTTPNAIHNKDLVAGFFSGKKTGSVLWKDGVAEVLEPPAGEREVWINGFAPDGRPLGGSYNFNRTRLTPQTRIGKEWRPLESFIVDFPKGTSLGMIVKVASNGGMLIQGWRQGQKAWFFLEPQ